MEDKKITKDPLVEDQKEIRNRIIRRNLITAGCIILGIAIIVFVVWGIRASGSKKADNAVAAADLEMNDSIALEKYMEAATYGYESGNRAKLNAAIILYQQGKYEDAIKYLDDASIKSEIMDAGRLLLMGDCYVNLDKYDEALNCYNKAIKASDDNPEIIPFALVKEANIYREQKNYEKEYEAYQKIFNEYPEYTQTLDFDIRKYAELARINAGK